MRERITYKKADRSTLPLLFKTHGFKEGVEVGVYEGEFSSLILKHNDLDMLYCVDPWVNSEGVFQSEVFNKAIKTLEPWSNNCNLFVQYSLEFASTFEDESLDFVYIDGNHSYEDTLNDIMAWEPKVREGGIVAGHDYSNKGAAVCRKFAVTEEDRGVRGVKSAVQEYIKDSPYVLNLVMEHSPAWWFIKNSVER